jgi:hypothetical protein
MGTFILCLRRHPCMLGPIISSLHEMVGPNKNLLTLFLAHTSAGEVERLMIEMVNQCEADNRISEVF